MGTHDKNWLRQRLIVDRTEGGTMREPSRFLFTLLGILIALAGWSAEPISERQRLQELVEKIRAENHIPGISVAIAHGSEPPLCATAGWADISKKIPVSSETSFYVGSVSKNMFGTAVLILVDDGRVSLDDKLSKYVQWPQGDEITLRMLLNHTSGIPEWLTSEIFENQVDGVPEFFRTSHNPSQIMALMPNRSPVFAPGSKQQYSNTNGLLVGEVIVKITGKKLGVVFDERLAKPLGLAHTYLYGEATVDRPRARGYCDSESTNGEYQDCSYADEALPDAADGSVVSTAGDLVRYHRALRGGKLISERSWEAMNTVDPGCHNGLAYLVGEGPFGEYAGNVGRAMGHVAFNVYYADHDLYVAVLLNHGQSQIRLDELVAPMISP